MRGLQMKKLIICSWLAPMGVLLGAGTGHAATLCDRACLSSLADQLLNSMVAHAPSKLPLAVTYAASENGIVSALPMMTAWRTPTALKGNYYIVDPVSHQLYLLATLAEGPNDTLIYGRIKTEGDKISEVEIYENHSRGEGGFMFSGAGPANLPVEWTQSVDPTRVPSRSDLLKVGQGVFDRSISEPGASPDCVLIENGALVAENPDIAKAVAGQNGPKPKGKAYVPNADGTVPIPCGTGPRHTTDPKARVDIIDEQTGVVVSEGVLNGVTEPYLVTSPTISAYVPDQVLAPYANMLKQQQDSGKYTQPAIRAMRATSLTAHILRVYDGKIQGMMLLIRQAPPGSTSVWVQ
jgi:hypothetical protein